MKYNVLISKYKGNGGWGTPKLTKFEAESDEEAYTKLAKMVGVQFDEDYTVEDFMDSFFDNDNGDGMDYVLRFENETNEEVFYEDEDGDLDESAKKLSPAEYNLLEAKKNFEKAAKELEEARASFREEAKKSLKESRFKQTSGAVLSIKEITEDIEKAFEKVFKDAIEEKVAKIEFKSRTKESGNVLVSIDGRDAGFNKLSFISSINLCSSGKGFEIIPGDESMDLFRGDASDLKKDITSFLKDIFKKAEVAKIIKTLREDDAE